MMMGAGTMGSAMLPGGMGALLGSRATTVMNLFVEDVRRFLALRIDRINKRLKAGDVHAEDGTITADIVTADNSLVQRRKPLRRTGAIEYRS